MRPQSQASPAQSHYFKVHPGAYGVRHSKVPLGGAGQEQRTLGRRGFGARRGAWNSRLRGDTR
jgi:hypothetical protein